MTLSKVIAHFNEELPEDERPGHANCRTGAPSPRAAFLNVRFFGNGHWNAQVHNLSFEHRGEIADLSGDGQDGESAVEALIAKMHRSGEVFRLSTHLRQKGTTLPVAKVTNDIYVNPAA